MVRVYLRVPKSREIVDVIFADIIGSANDNDDLQIRASVGEFTPSNKREKVFEESLVKVFKKEILTT